MNNINHIIEEFRSGDSERRLSLYLAYRDLRPLFDQIENEETANPEQEINISEQMITEKENAMNITSPFRRVIRWCYSLLC
jgi:hypothetical protein